MYLVDLLALRKLRHVIERGAFRIAELRVGFIVFKRVKLRRGHMFSLQSCLPVVADLILAR